MDHCVPGSFASNLQNATASILFRDLICITDIEIQYVRATSRPHVLQPLAHRESYLSQRLRSNTRSQLKPLIPPSIFLYRVSPIAIGTTMDPRLRSAASISPVYQIQPSLKKLARLYMKTVDRTSYIEILQLSFALWQLCYFHTPTDD